MLPGVADRIRVVLAAMTPRQLRIVATALEQANGRNKRLGQVEFEIEYVSGRGLEILRRSAGADAVIFGLEDEELPGEASHVLAAYPGVKLVGVDANGWARVVVGAVLEPLSYDLPTVILWLTRPGRDVADVRARTR